MLSRPQSPTPEYLEKLFNCGCQAHQAGDLQEAKNCYQQLLEDLPYNHIVHYNLGLVHYELGNLTLAQSEFNLALTDKEEDSDTLFNLALCHTALGEHKDAVRLYKRLLLQTPQNADCLYNLGGCYRQLGENEQAIACYQQVLDFDATYSPAISNLAYLYHCCGLFTLAETLYRELLLARPADESARFMLDSLTGVHRDNAPEVYVRNIFENYAKDFDQNLVVELGYDNPTELFQWFLQVIGEEPLFPKGLDLGCGTGLGGVPFKKIVRSLHGVDLSGNMLVQAEAKGVYAELHQDSIEAFLGNTVHRYNLFIATDVFIYIGALERLFRATFEKAEPSAYFCFSTEKLVGEEGFNLMTSGRFAYSNNYICKTARKTGWTVLGSHNCRLRRERDAWIAGELWLLKQGELETVDTLPGSCSGQ